MMPDLTKDLLVALLLGSYVYATSIFVYLVRKIERFEANHLRHAERAINEVRRRIGLGAIRLHEGEDD